MQTFDEKKLIIQDIHKLVTEKLKYTKRKGRRKNQSIFDHFYIDFIVDDVEYNLIVSTKRKTITSIDLRYKNSSKTVRKSELPNLIERIKANSVMTK